MTTPYPSLTPDALAAFAAGLPAIPLYFKAKAPGQLLISGEGIITGFSVHNTDGAAAHNSQLLDGTDATGVPWAFERLTASGTDVQATSPPGLLYRNGIYVQDANGFLEGAVWVIPL